MAALRRISFLYIKCLRWRRASKCKMIIKSLQDRLIIQKRKNTSNMKQFRMNIAQLLENAPSQSGFERLTFWAQQIHGVERILLGYDQLELFCACVLKNIDEVTGCRKLSNEVCEAVSSLIFAASRQGGVIPELQILRLFFQRIFGQKFERINVDLLPGNKVNSGIVRNLDIIKTVSENVTNEIISEIWKEVKQNPGARLSDSPYYGVASADGIASFAAIKGAKKTAIVQEKKEKDFVAGRNEKVTKTTYKVNAYDDDHRQEEHLQGEKSPEAIPKTPSHVHPKLPDYDDLVLKFRNLKG